MATTGSGYVRPAMPIPPEASPNHCSPQPSILRRSSHISPFTSPFTSPLSSPTQEYRRGSLVPPHQAVPASVPVSPSPSNGDHHHHHQDVPNHTFPGVDTASAIGIAGGTGGQAPTPTSPTNSIPAEFFRRKSSIQFAPLPDIPGELRRGSAASLGVSSRGQMLSGKNGAPGGASGSGSAGGGGQAVKRNALGEVDDTVDPRWELFKKQYAAKHTDPDPFDLGESLSSGVKSLWKKVKGPAISSLNANSISERRHSTMAAPQSTYRSSISSSSSSSSQPTNSAGGDRRGSAPVYSTSSTLPTPPGSPISGGIPRTHLPHSPLAVVIPNVGINPHFDIREVVNPLPAVTEESQPPTARGSPTLTPAESTSASQGPVPNRNGGVQQHYTHNHTHHPGEVLHHSKLSQLVISGNNNAEGSSSSGILPSNTNPTAPGITSQISPEHPKDHNDWSPLRRNSHEAAPHPELQVQVDNPPKEQSKPTAMAVPRAPSVSPIPVGGNLGLDEKGLKDSLEELGVVGPDTPLEGLLRKSSNDSQSQNDGSGTEKKGRRLSLLGFDERSISFRGI